MGATENTLLVDEVKGDDEYQYDINHYYGRNDPQPNTLRQRIIIYTVLILLSPLLLALFVIYVCMVAGFLLTSEISDYQKKTGKVLGAEFWFRAPGKLLQVTPNEAALPTSDGTPKGATSDIWISKDFVRTYPENGTTLVLDTNKHLSLRKSIEVTLKEDLRNGKFGALIAADTDRNRPRYLLHGWPEFLDPQGDEIWFTHARTTTWASLYSWSARLPMRWGTYDFARRIDLASCPEVLGYAYLMEVANYDQFYATDRIAKIGMADYNAPEHTPETETKIFCRYNYKEVRNLGDFPKGDPDAYVFKGRKVMDEANLKVLHRYRIMKPVLPS